MNFNRMMLVGFGAVMLGHIPAIKAEYNAPAPQAQPPMDVGIDEKLGKSVPLDLYLLDEEGQRVSLRQLIDKPTLLTLNYYRCVGLCTPQLNGVAEMIQRSDMSPGIDFQVLTVSFDPRDNPEIAGLKKQNYIKRFGPQFPSTAWRFMTGDPTATKRLADAVGFKFAKQGDDYVHAGAIIVLSPTGTITRYLNGVTYLPFDVKMAVNEAAQGRIGPTISKILKFCFSYDPAGRKYSLNVTRVAALFTVVLAFGFVVFVAIDRKRAKRRPKETP
jgi:protein SCO1/2